jgi:proline iminopeptidase
VRAHQVALGVGSAGLVVVVVSILTFANLAQRPLYVPGQVRGMDLGGLSATREADTWTLERGVRVAVHRAGAGRPVLLVHGGPGVPWDDVPPGLTALLAHHQLVTWDQRGCGASSRPVQAVENRNLTLASRALERTVGLTAQVADLERIRRVLGEERLLVLGHGFGALLAALWAAEFPEHVGALVLVAPTDVLVMPPEQGGVFPALAKHLAAHRRAELEAHVHRAFEITAMLEKSEGQLGAFNAELLEYVGLAARDARVKAPAPAPGRVGGFSVQAAWVGLGLRHDWRALMATVEAPVLVLVGERGLEPLAVAQGWAQAFPHARLEVLPRAGPFPELDAPELLAASVEAFLEQPDAPPLAADGGTAPRAYTP